MNLGWCALERQRPGVERWGRDSVDETKALGRRLRELRCWRGLTLRDAAGLAGLSFSFWGQVERGEKPVSKRITLEAMARSVGAPSAELNGQPWAPQDPGSADPLAGLTAIETVLACNGALRCCWG